MKVSKADKSVITKRLVVAKTNENYYKALEVFTYSPVPIPPALSSYNGKGLSKPTKQMVLGSIVLIKTISWDLKTLMILHGNGSYTIYALF